MIELKGFSKSYRSKNSFAVKDISFTIPDSSITGLLGPNGSGKSTIMKAICGFHFPTEGSIIISKADGTTFSTEEAPQLCMKSTGYVPELPLLPKDLTVKSFLNYAAEIKGLRENEIKNACDYVISECSLEKFLTKKIKTLSKGQKQRVSFAQAIIHKPHNLILDEPVSGLDPAQIIQMRELIQKLSKTTAILMSTHLLQEIYSLCSNICIISAGKITAYGTEKEIITQTKTDNLEAAFMKLTADNGD